MTSTESQIYGGKVVDLANPKEDDIDLLSISHALSKTCRFNGNTKQFYSVAQHSVLVSHLIPAPYAKYGLLHDAHEAFIGDITTPVKRIIGNAFDDLSGAWDVVIFRRYGIKMPSKKIKTYIKQADYDALMIEAGNLMWPCEHWQKSPTTMKSWGSSRAQKEFMKRAEELGIK